MIITICMCLHNWIQKSDQHFDLMFGSGWCVHEESISYPSAPPEDDVTFMRGVIDALIVCFLRIFILPPTHNTLR
jgi:hypothetical protein